MIRKTGVPGEFMDSLAGGTPDINLCRTRAEEFLPQQTGSGIKGGIREAPR